MSRFNPRRAVAAVALVSSLALSAPVLSADGPAASGQTQSTVSVLLGEAWSWLTGLWAADTDPSGDDDAAGLDHRCTIDPNGGGCSADHIKLGEKCGGTDHPGASGCPH
jgi:hypothetical protein